MTSTSEKPLCTSSQNQDYLFLKRNPPLFQTNDHTIAKGLLFLLLLAIGHCFLLPRLTTRFCYNSSDPGRVNSQCVYCNYYLFDSVLLGCTGSSALTVNITATQAFCVISQCLGQIRQSPIFLGKRRRRDVDEISDENTNKEDSEGQLSIDEEDPVMEILNRAIRSLQENTSSTDTLLNDFSPQTLADKATTDIQLDSKSDNRETSLRQELLSDLVQPSGVGYESSPVESTTEIIEFNLDGKMNKYIVKKEVQAVIVDIPEMYESNDGLFKNPLI